jgi:hypothetical protein
MQYFWKIPVAQLALTVLVLIIISFLIWHI